MRSYGTLAYHYDRLMAHVDYDAWVDFVLTRLGYPLYWEANDDIKKSGDGGPPIILDLACGTGNITKGLTERGYRVIGVDKSEDMLHVAESKIQRRRSVSGKEFPIFERQDMTEINLVHPVDACVCLCDSLNYLTENHAFGRALFGVGSVLRPGAKFVFDLHTENTFLDYAETIFAADEGDTAYVWESEYDATRRICTMYVTLFVAQDDLGDVRSDGRDSLHTSSSGAGYPKPRLYERYDEVHVERAFTDREVEEAIDRAGFIVNGTYGELIAQPPRDDEGRIFYVLEKGEDKIECPPLLDT